jgi:hypothetical protein
VTRGSLAVAAAMVLLLGAPSGATASITVGSGVTAPPDGSITCSDPDGCTIAQTRLHGRDVAAVDGVITRWRAAFPAGVGAQHVTLAVLRQDGNGFTRIGLSAPVTVAAGQSSLAADTKLPVRGGDRIALTLEQGGEIGTVTGPSADGTILTFTPPVGQFGVSPPDSSTTTDQELLLGATVEPDGDGDGEGDETQDLCPESPDQLDRPCSIDVALQAPSQSRLFVGFWGALAPRVVWNHDPALLTWLPAQATLTVEAPPHAPIVSADTRGHPCQDVTPQRAVCRVQMPPLLFGGTPFSDAAIVRTSVDPWSVPPSLARSGAQFSASLVPAGRDADPNNNRLS